MLDGVCDNDGDWLDVRDGDGAQPPRDRAGALPVGIVLFLLTPLVTLIAYPPTITRGSEVTAWARAELRALGPISRGEVAMAGLAVMALVGWIVGNAFVSPVIVSLIVISLMVVTGVVTWNDIRRLV